MHTIKTPSDLKQAVEQRGEEAFFFTRKTMSFFGDTMRNYGVRQAWIVTNREEMGRGVTQESEKLVYELYRKHPVKHGLKDSAYFDAVTFKRVFAVK